MVFAASVNASGVLSITGPTMFESTLTQDAPAQANAPGQFASGFDASGLIQVPSGFFASGLEASAMVKGTIGNFLATALAGSGLNASGQVQGPSGIFQSGLSTPNINASTFNGAPLTTGTSATYPSGLTACALVSVSASAIFTGPFSALDVEVSTINGSPPGGATSTFSSGLTACALISAAATALFACGLTASGTVAATSGTFASGLNVSAAIQAAAVSATNINASTIDSAQTSTLTYFTKGGVLISPVNASVVLWRAPFSCTVAAIRGYQDIGSNTAVNALHNGVQLLVSHLVISNTASWFTGGALSGPSFAAGDVLQMLVASVAGAPSQVAVQVEFTTP